MRVLLDTLYLYRLMAAEGIFADPERTYLMRTDVADMGQRRFALGNAPEVRRS